MIIEEQVSIRVPAKTVFALYADVAHWHCWDPDTKWARLDGPMRVGATGKLAPTQGFPVRMTVTELETDRLFTVEARAPLCTMRFVHELQRQEGGVLAVHRVTFSGPLAGFFGRLVGGRVRAGLPATMQSLKRYAENLHNVAA
ncbi:MAG: SRPBCC family protein [Gammaproteobacteria bacterium]